MMKNTTKNIRDLHPSERERRRLQNENERIQQHINKMIGAVGEEAFNDVANFYENLGRYNESQRGQW